jgi:hypothetical protein
MFRRSGFIEKPDAKKTVGRNRGEQGQGRENRQEAAEEKPEGKAGGEETEKG